MKYNDVIDRLQNLTMSKINTTEIADVIGVPVRTLYTRSYRNSEVTPIELRKIEEYYNVILLEGGTKDLALMPLNKNRIIEIPYWEELPERLKIPDFTCVTAERDVIKNHWGLNPESLRIIPMVGDKLANYWYKINDSDILIIDTSHNYIMGNGVYFATSRNNTRFWIREMQNLINDDVQIKGYSPSGDTVKVFNKQQLDEVDFKIIGKVIKNVSFRL